MEDAARCHGENILHGSPLLTRDAVMLKKHAAGSLSETEGQRNQPPDDAEVTSTKRQSALRRSPQTDYFIYLFSIFFLPVSKNSDLRFRFFKDRDSDST